MKALKRFFLTVIFVAAVAYGLKVIVEIALGGGMPE